MIKSTTISNNNLNPMKNKKLLKVAVVSPGNIISKELVSILENRNFPIETIEFISPPGTEGKILQHKNENRIVTPILKDSFLDLDLAFFLLKEKINSIFKNTETNKTLFIDVMGSDVSINDIPLIVPEINSHILKNKDVRIISVPSSIAIQLSTILFPIKLKYGLRRVIVSTYRSVSNYGEEAIDKLARQTVSLLNFEESNSEQKTDRIAFNCIPEPTGGDEDDYSKDEKKAEYQLKKLLGQDQLNISINSATVPVFHCDSMFVNIETEDEIPGTQLKNLFKNTSCIINVDDNGIKLYPTSSIAANKDEIFIGRLRKDRSTAKGINLWSVMDNLRKGSALTAVHIAEELVKLNYFD